MTGDSSALVPLSTAEVVTIAAQVQPKDIEKFVYGLPAERVPEWAVRLKEHIATCEKMLEKFEVRMTIDSVAGWQDPITEERYAYIGRPGNRECRDPEGLRHSLYATLKTDYGKDQDAANTIVQKALPIKIVPSITELDKIAETYPKTKRVIRDFTPRKPRGPAHLQLVKDDDD